MKTIDRLVNKEQFAYFILYMFIKKMKGEESVRPSTFFNEINQRFMTDDSIDGPIGQNVENNFYKLVKFLAGRFVNYGNSKIHYIHPVGENPLINPDRDFGYDPGDGENDEYTCDRRRPEHWMNTMKFVAKQTQGTLGSFIRDMAPILPREVLIKKSFMVESMEKVEKLLQIFEGNAKYHIEPLDFTPPETGAREAIIENIVKNPDNWEIVRNQYGPQDIIDLFKSNAYVQQMSLGEAKEYMFDTFLCHPRIVEEAYRVILINGRSKYQPQVVVEDRLGSLPEELSFKRIRIDENLVKQIVQYELKENKIELTAEQLQLAEKHFGIDKSDLYSMNEEQLGKLKNLLNVSQKLDENALEIANSNGNSLEQLRRVNLKLRKQMSQY